ncbi:MULTISPECIES: sigma-54-dependent Fis family transcriptional regulator [Azotobacter]|nr:sigma-54-dependent Fis family transcriptional regulator [Azotobacter vinelandii]GLK61475.1 sigma-54-dependent Fis family transcriptional regulator [Azotobacter vinelandii]SFX85223.1 Transcriptional regulator of acetoin/glycerol metabolism [Azotobacter vinelandii]
MPATATGQMFPVPENDDRIKVLWERFLNGGEPGSDALRRLIDDSWRRCLGASVDPDRFQAPPPLSEHSLHSLRDESADLLSASAPIMAAARDFLAETGTVMVLANPSGTILNLEGDVSTRGLAENIYLLSGANWSELACGTNAIGTALEVGQPVQIHSAEHYCAGIKRWSCSATVIRDPCDGSILGVVDVSGLSASYSRHSLALVVATAGRIESRLAKMEMDVRYRLLETCIGRLSPSATDGIVVFDRRGRAIQANARASAMVADLASREPLGSTGELGALSLKWEKNGGLAEHLPEWMDPDWLQPVIVGNQHLGTLLTLPNRRAPGAGAASPAVLDERFDESGFDKVVGESTALLQAVGRARQLAKSRVPVLLLGETGVGKDVFARGIHESGATRDGPFVALNCGGFSRELLTSELFGYVEGSFTGARRGGMMGKIEAADGGTLFLDEIGEMPIDLQPHFLRVLEEGEVYRIGETKPRKVNFRLVAATNRDLHKEIQAGTFRMDLFYRVAVTSIHIPSLRERLGDIPLLGEHYLDILTRQHGLAPRTLSAGAVTLLQRYAWPGNIREFRNVIESMLLTSPASVLGEADVPLDGRCVAHATRQPEPDAQDEARDLNGLESAEREVIRRTVKGCRGNMTAVARELGIAKSTVYAKLKRFGLETYVEDLRNYRA